MKKVLTFLMTILVCSLIFTGSNGSTLNKSEPEFKHYEIDITMDNYWKFLDVSLSGRTYTINGVLSFAYYEDVLLEKLEERIVERKDLFNREGDIPKFVTAKLKNDAGIIGAAMQF